MKLKTIAAGGMWQLCFLAIMLISATSFSQITNPNANIPSRSGEGYQKVNDLFSLLKKSSDNYIITGQHTSKLSGVKHVYLQQAINGIGIVGTESSVHYDASGKALNSNNKFLEDIQNKIRSASASLTQEQAIEAVSNQMGYTHSNIQLLKNVKGKTQKQIYGPSGISSIDIPVELSYLTINNGVYIVWELSVMEKDSSDWWNFYVDAQTGTILNKINFTISCFEGDHDHSAHEVEEKPLFYTVENEPMTMVGSYNVFPLPLESPNFGTRSLVANPDNAIASPYGWHDTNGSPGAEFTRTQGNNCSAYDDDDNTNGPTNTSDYAEGGASLIFDFPLNLVYSGADQSEDAAITNLFYYTNIVHDVTYQYGFDEASGNFQENNYGNGGNGSDSVNAEGQDGSGTCNANFGTPNDGSNPRMQMYVCNTRDGDLDNGVIAHEYGHGISNRLTGGPMASNCLQNSEQMGEGWSDFYALLLSMETGDAGTDSRGIGTWLFGQGPNGPGIRNYPYSTNFAVNPHTYDDIKTTGTSPHALGEVWATMLWEMTWELVNAHGFSTDFYTVTGNSAVDAGNIQALALVTEGLKLQPCSPGFVDGRDAILLADQNIYGGVNQCIIWEAFARRGLGYSADQGSSASRTDGTEAFDLPPGTASFTPTISTLCITEGIQTGLGGGAPIGGVYSGSGVTDDGNGTTFTFDPSIPGAGDTTVTYTVVDACSGALVNLDETIFVNDGIPDILCQDVTLTLNAGGSITVDPFFNQATIIGGNNGSNSAGFSVLLTTVVEDVDITFDWAYSTTDGPEWDSFGYVIGTNYIPLSDASAANQSGTAMLSLNAGEDFGFAVYTVDNTFGAATGVVTNFAPGFIGQFEESNFTDVQQNSDGSAVIDQVNFLGVLSSCSTTSLGGPLTFTCLNVGDNVIQYQITDDLSGFSSYCSPTITIIPNAAQLTTFTGGAWNNGVPTATSVAVFNDDYSTAIDGDVEACSCLVETANTVTVTAGNYLNIQGNINVDGSLIVEHQGSVVQVEDDASVNNLGTINVNLTTPDLASRDFMVLGSPMSGESREDVWNSAFLVLLHDTNNFVPNPDVEAVLGGAENFADDNYDNWIEYSNGPINVGEGYIVRPQAGYGEPGGIFNYTYDTGTLNNGIVEFPVIYNVVGTPAENRNASPNIVSNPYASAIFADDFINDNSMVDAVYFWEHLTPPSPSIPGAGSMNFDMQDISMYNLTGGTAAGNDPGTTTEPNGFISTGQGFGVKASGSGTIVFNNAMRRTTGNNTLRQSNRDRVWLKVSQLEYELQNTTLLAFSEETTAGYDNAFDGNRLATVLSIYSHYEDGSGQLGIQSREALSEDKQVPIGFSTLVEGAQEYKISLEQVEGELIDDYNVYLIDNVSGNVTNLREDSYSFISDQGVFHERFTLVFNTEQLGMGEVALNGIMMYPNPTSKSLNIFSPNAMITTVQVYDLQGRLVNSIENQDNSVQMDMSTLSSSVYFVQIHTELGTITKRMVKE